MKKEITMSVVNANAAGIDIGSKSHFIAVGQGVDDIKEFDVTTEGHKKSIAFLKEHNVTSIAMESTGSYWQSFYSVLLEAGFDTLLVPGNQTKNLRKKTDVKDAQWIQKLHSLGLLTGSFLPDEQTLRVRTIARHRASLVETCAKYTNKIQKSLRLMNIRLDVCIRDVAGKSGRAIIEDILAGERDPNKLVCHVDARVKMSQKEIVLHLEGQWNDELLYELKDSYELLKIHEDRIKNCDLQIEQILSEHNRQEDIDNERQLVKKQNKGKHVCTANLSKQCYEIFGVDIFSVNGIGPGTSLTFISEMGMNIFKFPSAKHFSSWLRLAPNNRISGGKVISSRTDKSRNQLTKAFRDAANAAGLSKGNDYLAHFFRRIAFKKGRGAAITATARKISVIVWNMIVKRQEYNPITASDFMETMKQKKIKQIQKDVKKFGILNAELSMA